MYPLLRRTEFPAQFVAVWLQMRAFTVQHGRFRRHLADGEDVTGSPMVDALFVLVNFLCIPDRLSLHYLSFVYCSFGPEYAHTHAVEGNLWNVVVQYVMLPFMYCRYWYYSTSV